MSARRSVGSRLRDRLRGRPAQRRRARLCLGLDYGTSTTKVILTARVGSGNDSRRAVPIEGHFCYPSIVVEEEGHVFFGPCVPKPGRTVYRSLKMGLRDSALGRGKSTVATKVLPVEAAVWGFLSVVVTELREAVESEFPDDRFDRTVEWHLGVPLDLEQDRLERTFAEVFYRSVHFGTRVRQGVLVRELVDLYTEACEEPVPPAAESDCLVFAEAAVAVNAILHQQGQDPLPNGKYFVSDVGAGTIDTAFFWYVSECEPPINFYGTSSVRCGGDDFVQAFAERLFGASPSGAELEEAEERLRAGEAPTELKAFETVRNELGRARTIAFGRALQKEHLNRWRYAIGYALGGGASLPGVAATVLAELPTGIGKETLPTFRRRPTFAAIPGATDLHGIALGLSIFGGEFHDYDPDAPPVPSPDTGDGDDKPWLYDRYQK